MADIIFEELFSDEKALKYLEEIEKQLSATGDTAEATGKQLEEALSGVPYGAVDALDELQKKYKEIAKATEVLKSALQNATDPKFIELYTAALAQLDKEMGETEKAAKAAGIALEQNKKAAAGWTSSIRQAIGEIKVFGKSISDWKEQVQKSSGAADIAGGATTKLGKAWSVFNNILKASIIGAIIALVLGLINYVSKLQPVIDFASKAFAVFNAIVKVVAERIVLVGSAFSKLFSGDFSGAFDDLKGSVSGLGAELVNASKAAIELEGRIQALRDAQIKNSVELAKQSAQLENLKKAAEDETLSYGKRIAAIKEAQEVNKSYTKTLTAEAKERIKIAEDEIKVYGDNAERQEKLAAERINLLNVENAATERQREGEKELREIRKQASEERRRQMEEEARRAEQLRKEYEKLFSSIVEQADALEIENTFNPFERVLAQFEASKAQINQLRERLLEIAPDAAARQRVEEEVDRLFAQLLIKYREEYAAAADEVEKLRKERLGDFAEAVVPIPKPEELENIVSGRVKNLLATIKANADEFIESQQPRSILKILGISEESFAALKDATSQIVDSLGQIADARVREAEAATAAAEEKVRAAEDLLEREQELASEGLANSVERAEENLETQKKLRDEALKEEAKARRAQVLLDSVGQISSLITASANIFKSLSAIQFVGIPLAIATIGVMFAAFAKAKSDALKAAAVPKLRKGAKLKGESHEQGGMAIVGQDGRKVAEVEGDEWLIGREPSREHDKFLNELNAGKYRGVDLSELLGGNRRGDYQSPLAASASRIERIEREWREARQAQEASGLAEIYRQASDKIVQAIEAKEVVYPLPNGYKVKTRKGRNTETEIVTFEK